MGVRISLSGLRELLRPGGRRGRRPPRWSSHHELREHVFEILESPAPSISTGFVHRDYQPAQMLFEGSRVTGICDWLTACRGPHGIDLARRRLNLAEGWGVKMAEEFRTSYRALVGEERVDPYWDLLDAADVLLDLPDRSPAQVLPGHGDSRRSGPTGGRRTGGPHRLLMPTAWSTGRG